MYSHLLQRKQWRVRNIEYSRMNFNMAKSPKAIAPLKGSFPLDKQGKCREHFMSYMTCLKANEGSNHKCRTVAGEYFKCRMENGLMEREDLQKIGYGGIGQEEKK